MLGLKAELKHKVGEVADRLNRWDAALGKLEKVAAREHHRSGISVDLDETRRVLSSLGEDLLSAEQIDGPQMGSLSSDWISYQASLGMSDGRVIHGPPEEITWVSMSEDEGSVLWRESPTLPEEREVTWSDSVPHDQKDEVGDNGLDDNGNGLDDEGGLAFTMEGARVDIHVTVEHLDENGRRVPLAKSNNVTCRN